jgi:hypothetical protein
MLAPEEAPVRLFPLSMVHLAEILLDDAADERMDIVALNRRSGDGAWQQRQLEIILAQLDVSRADQGAALQFEDRPVYDVVLWKSGKKASFGTCFSRELLDWASSEEHV